MQRTVIFNASDTTLKGHGTIDDKTLQVNVTTKDGMLDGHISTNKTLKEKRTS